MATIRKRSWTTASGEPRESWQVDFVDQHGKRRHRQFERKRDADRWLLEARGQVERGTFTADSASISVGEAAQLWLERCERDDLEAATLTQYRSHAKHHIEPLLGAVKLSRLSTPRVERFVDEMLAGGRTRATAKKVLASLKSLIKEAQRRGLVSQNVATGVDVKLAKRHEKKVIPPTPETVQEALKEATGRRKSILLVAAGAGLRASEIRGLRWQDVDFKAGLLKVRQRADTSGRIGSLKSTSARRDIPMMPILSTALKEWRLASAGGDGLVFPGRKDHPICHNTVLAMIGGRAHPFRHFFASWLIDQGFGPKRVQALMGHSSIQVTFDVYGHLFPQEDDAERFAAGERTLVG